MPFDVQMIDTGAAARRNRGRGAVDRADPWLSREPRYSWCPQLPVPSVELFRKIYQDRFLYRLYFQEPGVAEAELDVAPAPGLR
jgi:hypothetical protein